MKTRGIGLLLAIALVLCACAPPDTGADATAEPGTQASDAAGDEY